MVARVQVLIYCLHVITMRRYIQVKPAAPLAPFQLPANLIMYGLDGGPRHLVVVGFMMRQILCRRVSVVIHHHPPLSGYLPIVTVHIYMPNMELAHVPMAAMSVSVP